MGWKTRQVMVITEEKYFQMEIDDLIYAINDWHIQNMKSPQIIIVHPDSMDDLEFDMAKKIAGYCDPIVSDKGEMHVMGITVICSPNLERDALDIY